MTGVQLIAEERQRQISEEGYDAEHDRAHGDELARAGAQYATPERWRDDSLWPWEWQWWKPTPEDRKRELVKAGALVAAAIDALEAQ